MRAAGATTVLLLCAALTQRTAAQHHSLDSLLRAHRYPLEVQGGTLGGRGAELILHAARSAQFVGILEEHNVRELAEFAAALFDTLRLAYGFQYAALEQGRIVTSWLASAARAGGQDSVDALVRRWPHAPTFATDEELALIGHIAATSAARSQPVWGLDQELGALHILERLAALAPSDDARRHVAALAATARRYEHDRLGDTLYLAEIAVPEDFASLPGLFQALPGSEATQLIAELQYTSRVYHNHTLSRRGRPTGYENARERELGMKQRFMAGYNRARAAGDTLPRVLLKLGHWHLLRGIYRGNVPTLGNFASELATSNGLESLLLSTYVVDGPEPWRNSATFAPLALPEARFTVIDFRPLRPYAHQGSIDNLSDAWKSLLFQADAALIVRGGRTGSYQVTGGGTRAP